MPLITCSRNREVMIYVLMQCNIDKEDAVKVIGVSSLVYVLKDEGWFLCDLVSYSKFLK